MLGPGGDKCQNSHLVLGWSRVDLFSKSGEDFVNTHWPQVHNTRKECTKRRQQYTTGEEVNLLLLLHHCKTRERLEKNQIWMSLKRVKEETLLLMLIHHYKTRGRLEKNLIRM